MGTMDPTDETSQSTSGSTGTGSHLPWHLIPAFDPGETDMTEYARRLEFLAGIWPAEHLSQLAPRAALQCKGSAFQKVVRIKPEQLKVNSTEGIKLLVTTLGGVWGKTVLEDKYGKFERAIYGVSQRSDESNESYVARHDVLFEDVLAQGATFNDMRAYILLRNSALSPEDKKRVIIEAQGNLKYDTVTTAIRMLGARFFHEVQGAQKNYKSKTYDVNFTQEAEEDTYMMEDQSFVFAAEAGELPEAAIEQLLNEGDEDALVVQQFEDNDGEMSAYMNTYVEARRRLTEKSKSRCFWPVRQKGFGKKGKGKGAPFRGRKPLAVRIAESDCRLCGQRGHWKAECPRRGQVSSTSSTNPRAQAANVMVSVNDELDDDEADVFVMAEMSTSLPDVSSSVQDSRGIGVKVITHDAHTCHAWPRHHDTQKTSGDGKKKFYNQVKQCITRIMRQNTPGIDRKPAETVSVAGTPSPRKSEVQMKPPFSIRDSTESSIPMTKSHVSEPGCTENKTAAEVALFATTHAMGIVDLGASQTVMGRHQVREFLDSLPTEVQRLVHERPVEMSFRFGNNNVVPCNRAMFIPVDKFWIKIAIVETRTPFLISNNVCRSLDAIIDTSRQCIFFQKLNCELPLELSGKKLFLLDFCALTNLRPPRTETAVDKQESCQIKEELIFHNQENRYKGQVSEDCDDVPPCSPVQNASVPNTTESPLQSIPGDQDPVLGAQTVEQCQLTDPTPQCHVEAQSCRSFRCHESEEEPSSARTEPAGKIDGGARQHDSSLRTSQAGSEVLRSERGCLLLQVVPAQMGRQREVRTSSTDPLPPVVDRTTRTRAWSPRHQPRKCGGTDQFCSVAQGQSQGDLQRWQVIAESGPHRLGERSGRGRVVGSSDTHRRLQGEQECQALGSTGRSTERSSDTAEGRHRTDDQSTVKEVTPDQGFMIEKCIQEYQPYILMIGKNRQPEKTDLIRDPCQDNSIFLEMMQYGHEHCWISPDGTLMGPKTPGVDLLEVYCASDSQLTHQCIRQGLKAMRFGLREGNLEYFEGRCKLYEIIFRHRPRHLWFPPNARPGVDGISSMQQDPPNLLERSWKPKLRT